MYIVTSILTYKYATQKAIFLAYLIDIQKKKTFKTIIANVPKPQLLDTDMQIM